VVSTTIIDPAFQKYMATTNINKYPEDRTLFD